jgi:hypothetical protein
LHKGRLDIDLKNASYKFWNKGLGLASEFAYKNNRV